MVLLSPNINILIVVPGGVVELHEELDEAECLDVHVVGVHLVPHGLGPAAAHAEHHDGLQRRRNYESHRSGLSEPPSWLDLLYLNTITIYILHPASGHINLRETPDNP